MTLKGGATVAPRPCRERALAALGSWPGSGPSLSVARPRCRHPERLGLKETGALPVAGAGRASWNYFAQVSVFNGLKRAFRVSCLPSYCNSNLLLCAPAVARVWGKANLAFSPRLAWMRALTKT